MIPEEFQILADAGYNRIPLMREVLADLETPLSAYMKLANGPYSYLFESVQGGEKWGRYSIIGLPSSMVFKVRGNYISIEQDGITVEQIQSDDPLKEIELLQQDFRVPEVQGMPRFTGGLVGYFGYDSIGYIENRLKHNNKSDPLGCPDILLMVSEKVIVFDNLTGKLYIIVHANPEIEGAYESGLLDIEEIQEKLQTTALPPIHHTPRQVSEADFVSDFSQEEFEQAVDEIKRYIVEGDAMQVVLSQRLTIPFEAPPINLYRALRCLNPSPYMYYLNLNDFNIVGSSPEILVRKEDEKITVRPIAGTRPRGATEEEDNANEFDLMQDPKELAEHLMLIDLGRNDIGRVARVGSVELTENMVVERYSHVMHIVSNVVGELEDDLSCIDVLRATFPAGTVSGAPKIRAIEIIDELEPVKRGVYAGAVGYLSWNGNMDTAIAIRTAIIKDHILSIQAGAGIVADSVPQKEWEETMNKGRAIFRAVNMAERGLNRKPK